MKYALIFAATAAASYDADGSYPENAKSSSTAVKPTTSAKPIGYTTIYPGYGKNPVTVTAQHQPYPTCVSAGYGGKDCGKWEDDKYVSTTIKDYDHKTITVTKVNQPVTVYHTKKTITHSATSKYGYPTSSAGSPLPTGSAYKNGTEDCWYELYEKIEEVPYNQLGAHALSGYPGSGLYPEGNKQQPVHVKEYKGGKWTEYEHTYSHGKPEAEVTTYEKPGVYTVPAKDVTVDYPVTHPAEATKTARAGETCTYGGQYIDAKQTGYVTGAYGAYETKVQGGKTVTETVVKYTTVWASTTGKVEVTKPTTTVYDHDTQVAYPTAKSYAPGVYHHDAQTVTVTKPGEAYTCKYEQTKSYAPTPKDNKSSSAHPTATSEAEHYGYKASASATPSKPAAEENKYPAYPVQASSSSSAHAEIAYPASSPAAVSSKPAKSSSNPCPSSEKKPAATSVVKPSAVYPASSPAAVSSKPTPAAVSSKPSYNEYPVKASSSPCPSSNKKPAPTSVVKPSAIYPASTPAAVSSKPSYSEYPAKSSSSPCPSDKKPAPTSVVKPSSAYPAQPTAVKPVYSAAPYAAQPSPVKPAAYSPAPYVAQPAPVQSAPVKPAAYSPAPYPAQPKEAEHKDTGYGAQPQKSQNYGSGYSKRDSIMERRARAL